MPVERLNPTQLEIKVDALIRADEPNIEEFAHLLYECNRLGLTDLIKKLETKKNQIEARTNN